MKNLEGKKLRNSALVALDYQTGELVAYVGSADYYATLDPSLPGAVRRGRPGLSPAGLGVQAVQLRDRDRRQGDHGRRRCSWTSGTDFGGGYTPADADSQERGPVRVRSALQFSLNIPAVKAMGINSPDHVFARAKDFGMKFQGAAHGRTGARARRPGGPAGRPGDGLRDAGQQRQGDRAHDDPGDQGRQRARTSSDPYAPPEGTQVISPQAAYIVTDILAGNTNKNVNPFWGQFAITGPGRASAGHPQDRHQQRRQGPQRLRLHRAADRGWPGRGRLRPGGRRVERQLATTAWSRRHRRRSSRSTSRPIVWQGFLKEASQAWPETNFERPADGPRPGQDRSVDRVPLDRGERRRTSGSSPGTEPTAPLDPNTCGIDVVSPCRSRVELRLVDDRRSRTGSAAPGVARARSAARTGRASPTSTPAASSRTARRGVPLVDAKCGEPLPTPSCFVVPTPDPSGVVPSFEVPEPSGSDIAALPCPTPSPTESPSDLPSEEPSTEPSAPPSAPPTPAARLPTPTRRPRRRRRHRPLPRLRSRRSQPLRDQAGPRHARRGWSRSVGHRGRARAARPS